MSLHELTIRLGYGLLLALALTLPFELDTPLLHVGPLAISNTEMVLGSVLVMAAAHWLVGRSEWFARKTPAQATVPAGVRLKAVPPLWLLLLGLYLGGLLLSALLAPEFRGNALRAALRTLAGMLLVPAVLLLVPSRKAWWGIVVAAVAGGVVAAAVGLSEVFVAYDFEWLRPWRSTPTVAGPFLRLAGPFDYANQAAMYFEATLPLMVALGIVAWGNGRRLVALGWGIALLLYAQAAILTFSRAALGTIVLSHLLVCGWLLISTRAKPTRQNRMAWWWGGTAGAVLLLIAANFVLSPVFRLRLQSQTASDWYQANIQAPSSLVVGVDETLVVPVTIHNTGSLTWFHSGTNSFRLGMRWQLENGALELSRHPRQSLDHRVEPGETIVLQVPLRAPVQSGQYELVWDMVHENVTWFGAKNPTEARSRVTVTGDSITDGRFADYQLPAVATAPLQFDAPIPGRATLWRIALKLFALHPLTGIGLDNFRLIYGRFIDTIPLPHGSSWNDTIHTNNWYLETLVSHGIIGTLPFFAWVLWLLFDFARTLRAVTRQRPPGFRHGTGGMGGMTEAGIGLIAVTIGLLAYIIHGLLDYFMLFNATALLFWLLVGLWLNERKRTIG